MKKFGLGKKDSGEEETKRARFGSRSKSKTPAPSSNNPYAQTAASDPYTQAKVKAGIAPHDPGAGTSGSSKSKMNSSAYGDEMTSGGYGGNAYGDQGGYGQEKFGSGNYNTGAPARGGTNQDLGGYGGLGPPGNDDAASIDPRREELFGGARDRMQQRGPSAYGQPPPYGSEEEQGTGQNPGYGAYGDRQLTAEEEAEEDIEGNKQEMKFMKQQDVASTRNALRAAAQAEETGRGTLARLGGQGERLHNADKNLDLSANHQRIAEQKAKELKVANRSMFRMHVDNPFTKGGRERRDQEILDRHRDERDQRESTRQAAFQSEQRMNEKFKTLGGPGSNGPKSKATLAERAKYQFEADSEDDEMEDEIENNIDELTQATGRLGQLAKAQGEELQHQNRLLDRLTAKTDKVDDHIAVNSRRLQRIK